MSESPSDLLGLRGRLATETGLPVADIGIAADEEHLANGGYHCGGLDLRRINAVGKDDYSIRQTRDRKYYDWELVHDSNWASAMDVGDDWPRGGRDAWIRFNNSLRGHLGGNDPALAAVRGMNYTPNGTTKRRFDHLSNIETSTTDTVLWHTHIEFWRDTIATAVRAAAINRIVAIAAAARDDRPVDPATPVEPVQPPLSIGETDVIYQVTNVPAGTTDCVGNTVPENGQCLATASGPFNLTGDEFFSLPASAQPVRIKMSWSRLVSLCGAMRSPANLSDAQFADFKREVTPIVHDAAQTGAASGIDGAIINVPTA
jgi:hypothetical protein